ncbi:hypothetical protein GCM10010252_69480 [Streptomyces aureoverticillatus]|nr:hypothetical protein GCM10010252_69480 [Streptomyces aureoverticillatus]
MPTVGTWRAGGGFLRPHPLGDVAGKPVWLATTADRRYGDILERHLADAHGAHVTGVSHALADRRQLLLDLEERPARSAEVLAVELTAAAVDVVTRWATDRGIEAVYTGASRRCTSTTGRSPPTARRSTSRSSLCPRRPADGGHDPTPAQQPFTDQGIAHVNKTAAARHGQGVLAGR